MTNGWLLRVVGVALFVLVLHVGVTSNMPVFGIVAELPIGLAIAAGLAGGVERGAIFGFAFGFALDVLIGTPIGLGALVLGAAGWVGGHVFLDRIEESPVVAALAIGLGTAVGLVVFVSLGIALGETGMREIAVVRLVLVASIVNALAAFGLMFLAHWMWSVDPLSRRRGIRL